MVTSPCIMSPSCLSDLAIVVVEDHTTHEGILIFSWVNWAAKVVVASNALEGLRAIKNTLPDLVLSDIQMPGLDGYELLENIRAPGPDAGGNVPVIAMSAFFSLADRARIHHAGFRACLPKPLTPDKLVETILGVL